MSTVVASLVANIGANTAGFEQGAKKVKGGLTSLGSTFNQILPPGIAQFSSLAGSVLAVGTAMKISVDETVKYANEVRQLSTLSGASAEDTSRLIQVLDDYKITANDALLATKTLTAQGYTPSIDTLATLSDNYLSLTTAQEKNKFVLENLGKNGLKWVEVLGKGSKAIREQGAAVNKNLILNDKALRQSREYELALDNLNDSVYAMKIAIGQALIPTLINLSDQMTINMQDYQEFKDANNDLAEFLNYPISTVLKWMTGMDDAAESSETLSQTVSNTNTTIKDSADAVGLAKDALRDYEDQLDAVSQANLDMESMSRDIAESQKQYAQDHADAAETLSKAITEGDAEGIAKARKDIQDLEATWHESANNMIYDMVLVGLSAGGLLDSEQKALDEYAVKAGIKTQADIDEANRRREVADSTIAGILQSEDVLAEQRKVDAETLRLTEAQTSAEQIAAAGNEANAMGQVSAATQKEIELQMILAAKARNTAIQYASIKMVGPNMSPYKAKSGSTGGKSPDERDNGGSGIAGTPYLIGTGAQPELFVPSTSGTFIPNADKKGLGGSVINVYITNPKREAAENSVQRAVRNIIYTGAAA